MGGRLSVPRSPDGLTEVSKPTQPRYGRINPRTVVAPIAALTMAGLLYVYARTSIRAAKLNAQRTREADGGQLSWYKEGLRRHGTIEKVDEKGNLKQALLGKKAKGSEDTAGEATADGDVDGIGRHSAEEEKLGKFMGKGEAGKK